jgi:hypothetical protein
MCLNRALNNPSLNCTIPACGAPSPQGKSSKTSIGAIVGGILGALRHLRYLPESRMCFAQENEEIKRKLSNPWETQVSHHFMPI